MKPMNSLEDQLNTWKPRQPSTAIQRRLFSPAHARPELIRLINWLAPATACLLLVLAAGRQESALTLTSQRHEPLLATVLSNQYAVAYLPGGSSQIERNTLPDIFESTNRNSSSSTVGFISPRKTND